VRRLVGFSNQYPWQWNVGELEAFFAGFVSGAKPITVSPLRQYQTDLRLFLDYLTDGVTAGRANALGVLGRNRCSCCMSGTPWLTLRSRRGPLGGGR
jgi:hypothetical protein